MSESLPGRLIRVVDFETTGGEPPDTAIVEAGWCDMFEIPLTPALSKWTPGLPHAVLVSPDRPIDPEAMAVHHIRGRDVEFGTTPEDAFRRLGLFPRGEQLIAFAAHGSETEAAIWAAAPAPWICTYRVALRFFPGAPRHSNQVLRYWLGLDLPPQHGLPAHRAGPDAYVTAHILAHMFRSGLQLEDALRWSAEPALLPRVPFGRHRGIPWSEVDDGFLDWVLERDFSAAVHHTARMELQRREDERARQDDTVAAADEWFEPLRPALPEQAP